MAQPTPKPPTDTAELTITPEDILYLLRRRWCTIFTSAIAGVGLAYYAANVQPSVYERKASIILKDEKNSNKMAVNPIMAELGLGANVANVANEMHVLKSSPIMRRVVEELGLNTTYWQQEGLHRIELYRNTPLTVSFSNENKAHARYNPAADARPWYKKLIFSQDRSLIITPAEGGTYTLSYEDEAGERVHCEGRFGQPLQLPFATLLAETTDKMDATWLGKGVIINHNGVEATTRNYIDKRLVVLRPDVKEGSLLELSLKANNKRKAQEALDLLLATYNSMSVEETRTSAQSTKVFLEDRLTELNNRLAQSDRQLTEYKQQNALALDEQTTLGTDLMTSKELEKNIFAIETQLKVLNTLADDVRATMEKGGLIAADVELLKDSALTQQISAYNSAYLEFNKLVDSAGDKNPLVVNQRERMRSILSAIDKALANYRSNAEIRIRELHGQLEGMEARVEEGFVKRQEIVPLMRQHKVLEELYLLLLAKEQENALSIAAAEPRARILENAYGEERPVSPKKALYLFGGLIGGAGLSFLLLLAARLLNTKVRERQDFAPHCTLPIVAELPHLSRSELREGILAKGERSAMVEGLHILRNNVSNLLPQTAEGAPVILLTSTVPGEGKTTTTANLAAAYAQIGKRVLVIDGDLRRSTLTTALVGKGHLGLSSILLQREDKVEKLILPQSVESANGTSFDLLPAGPLPPSPVTLLSREPMRALMQELRRRYDIILLDAPPFAVVADTPILARHANLSLYLVRSGMVDRRYFAQVQRLADEGQLPNAVIVLNDLNFKSLRYTRYSYNYGYYHYNAAPKSPSAKAH